MQIYVCVKHVPDSAANIHILDDTSIDEDVAFLLNPYDEHAVTEAVKIKAQFAGSEIVAVTVGKPDAENTLRSAMAMGADRGILITADPPWDAMATARALAAAIREDGEPMIVLTGKESIDAEGMQTQFRLGALLGMPVVTNAAELIVAEKSARITCELSGGMTRTFEAGLPCVVGAGRGLNTPGYPTLPAIMKSRKKPVKEIALGSLDTGAGTRSAEIVRFLPLTQTRSPKEITGTPAEMAEQIIKVIKKEGGLA
ncbi:MAG: electron transfer flavoprotein subunit beta/FixA family protein [Desulfobacter sp.]|nr:MAG: electron transfer flavoprotein subunit beta/FixA family protein [Desulfobacter sp.]